jgi:hypothetical protein
MNFGRAKHSQRRENSSWGYEWDGCNNNDGRFDFNMNFVIKVPRTANVLMSTINNGNVEISNVAGTVKAFNINGSISLAAIKDVTLRHLTVTFI